MNQRPTAGTFRLDGMLQGTLNGEPKVVEDIEAWVADARRMGLRFHLRFEGSGFSILGASGAIETSQLRGNDLTQLMEDGLRSLVDLLPDSCLRGILSTIRSEEFVPGTVTQTLYSIDSSGEVTSEQRTREIETEDPLPELTPASLRKYILFSLLTLFVGLFVSSFFIDYRKMFSEARDQVVPLSKEEVALSTGRLGNVVEVKLLGVDNRKDAIILEISRGPDWKSAMESAPENQADWRRFLMHQAVHNRRLRVELYNKKGELLTHGEITLDDLYTKNKSEVAVVARLRDRLAKVVVCP